MSTRRNSNARGRATARSIEAAAVRLASEKGVAALTVLQICAEAGVAQRTFFNHFETKEDALLGKDLPQIHEQRTRKYLSSQEIGVLSGALELVELPEDGESSPELLRARLSLLSQSPALAERQASRLMPLADEVRTIIRLKLETLDPKRSPGELDASAGLITQMASSLMLSRARPTEGNSAPASLRDLTWIWDRLL
ncbi:TetR/AcrR family transcriptional regulator [Paenarthrobacter sp. MSM-2-10-13]|uniref:TetR/AcrR family transcriptional regulator n=1 Tax=Paenarthrobacter sp. MSM-2-10-13 TaxID=2717318 RepID=UPI001AA15930|nr:TetR/AcrR family transcriptional regulator [Paenarthrobacter sp. MSM-2-10-13]